MGLSLNGVPVLCHLARHIYPCSVLAQPMKTHPNITGATGVLDIWGEWLFIFRELRSTGNYFREPWEQAHGLGVQKKETPPFF